MVTGLISLQCKNRGQTVHVFTSIIKTDLTPKVTHFVMYNTDLLFLSYILINKNSESKINICLLICLHDSGSLRLTSSRMLYGSLRLT